MADWTICFILGALIVFTVAAGIAGYHALNDGELRRVDFIPLDE